MRRREFLGVLGAAAAWPVLAQGQRQPIVGYLSIVSGVLPDQLAAAFRRGLSETGFTDGRNVTFKYASAEGQITRLPALAEKLVGDGVDVIAAMGGSRSALAAKGATKSIPIVFTMGDADPVQVGAVASLARPGGNLTGISLLGGLLGAKRLELLRELVPNAKTIGVLINPENRNGVAEREELEIVIRNAGQQVVVGASTSVDDVSQAISYFAQSRVDALLVTADPIFTGKRVQIAALAAQYRIPAI